MTEASDAVVSVLGKEQTVLATAAMSWADVAKRGLPAAAATKEPIVETASKQTMQTDDTTKKPTAAQTTQDTFHSKNLPSKKQYQRGKRVKTRSNDQQKDQQQHPFNQQQVVRKQTDREEVVIETRHEQAVRETTVREQIYVAPPPLPSTGTQQVYDPSKVFFIPLYADLVRMERCAKSIGDDDGRVETVYYCHIPVLGDRLCDFYLVAHPSLLNGTSGITLQKVRLGAIGAQQNCVWLEWNSAQLATARRSAGGYAIHIDAGAVLRAIPTATRTGIAINVFLSSNADDSGANTNDDDSGLSESAESPPLYIITRQQHFPNVARTCCTSIEGDTFRITRHNGAVSVFCTGGGDNVAQWRAARECQIAMYGPSNAPVDVLPSTGTTMMLPFLENDPWGAQTVLLPPPQSTVPLSTINLIAMLTESKDAPSQFDLTALGLL
jgi:hypothetical protein